MLNYDRLGIPTLRSRRAQCCDHMHNMSLHLSNRDVHIKFETQYHLLKLTKHVKFTISIKYLLIR